MTREGSGNFLTESYISLRRLENKAIKERYRGEMFLGDIENPIKVSINQMHGIEINDFAVAVAKTALWIAEAQMWEETRELVSINEDFLPLHSNSNIIEGNALRMDWDTVCSRYSLTYIIGNPPFLGARLQDAEQKNDILAVFGKDWPNVGNVDYVAGWYLKATQMIYGTNIKIAFVSTNSITQGEQVEALWKPIYEKYKIHIDFAYRTFKWESGSKNAAAVHVVIIAFSCGVNHKSRFICTENKKIIANNINPYLVNAPIIFITKRKTAICDIPEIGIGSQPIDDGNYLFTENEMLEFIKKEPGSKKYFHRFYGAEEFLQGRIRFVLWLGDCSPTELLKMPECVKRVEAVRTFRSESKRKSTVKLANTPTHFQTEHIPTTNFILIPRHSSESRKYIPIGFMAPTDFTSDAVLIIPNATLYHFGILTSNVHMAWMREIAGRIKSDYRYSKDIVYNNFPWPQPTDQQRQKIERSAQAILDARTKFPDATLAVMYSKLDYFVELKEAHQANDRAVMEAYGMWGTVKSEAECVVMLFDMYQKLVESHV